MCGSIGLCKKYELRLEPGILVPPELDDEQRPECYNKSADEPYDEPYDEPADEFSDDQPDDKPRDLQMMLAE